MVWDNANKPVPGHLRNIWNSWTPWISEIMQINQFLNSLHSLKCSLIFLVYTWESKGHFFNVFFKVFWNFKFLHQLWPHWLRKTSKIPKKTILSFQLSECLIKTLRPISTKTVNSRNRFLCFRNLSHFRIMNYKNFINCSFLIVIILFGLNFVMTLTLCTVWH